MDRVVKAQTIVYPGPTRMPSDNVYKGRIQKLPNMDDQESDMNSYIPKIKELDFDRSRQYR